ncbi:MAG: cation transporter [Caldithrix sp. RBG_13_44_9]|nr:MAG: cation transporter [Caldithrix sp. RBG_13_44_9]
MKNISEAVVEKKRVALISVFAAIFLTGSKFLIGILTGSLGILSEALHSALDLIAAAITYFSVRISDKPADSDHHYGHGKIENISALIETFLLLITCSWIIYEAVHRLLTGKVLIEITVWSYLVVITSIIIDYSRSRALLKAAKKYNSQALEADALHFSTDIWSSTVVFIGLICANFGWHYADPIAALIVALIVIYVSYKLGKRSIDVLLDKAPIDHIKIIEDILNNTVQVSTFHDLRIRLSGANVFVDVSIHVDPSLNIEQVHRIADEIESRIHQKINRSVVHIHQEPEDNKRPE